MKTLTREQKIGVARNFRLATLAVVKIYIDAINKVGVSDDLAPMVKERLNTTVEELTEVVLNGPNDALREAVHDGVGHLLQKCNNHICQALIALADNGGEVDAYLTYLAGVLERCNIADEELFELATKEEREAFPA